MSAPSLLRSAVLWTGALTTAALVLCFVPLFNLLGYESCLALSLLVSVAAAHLGATALCAARHRQTAAAASRAGRGPLGALLGPYGRALAAALLTLVPPLVLLLANGLRVRNCDYLAGLSFFLIMPVGAAPCAAAAGLGAGLLLRRRFPAALLAWGVILLSLLWSGARFLRAPAIFAYDPFFGYFPGALYDEEVAILRPFLAARALHLSWLGGLLLSAAALLDGGGLRLRLRFAARRGRRPLLAGGGLLLCLAALGHWSLGPLGIYHDVDSVERTLSREHRTTHFSLRYAPGGPVARDIELYAREHELRYGQLQSSLGVEPRWRTGPLLRRLLAVRDDELVVSFLFDSARQKHELMGAANTYIAKPWRREIYLQHEGWPHPVLKHELAHIFLGAAGDPLLRVSLRGVVPHQGMVEGLAVAADWHGGGRLSPHQAVRAMRQAGLEPPLAQVFGLSFLAVSSGRAYTVAGSFCRYLLERFGAAPLLQVYRAGGTPAAFSAAFAHPFSRLASDWRAFIDRQPLSSEDREVERERVRRPAVFYKVCAHELALRRQEAREAQGRGDHQAAARLLSSICAADPAEPRHRVDLMDFYFGTGSYDQAALSARALLVELTDKEGRSWAPVLTGRALALLGDVAWLGGDEAEARRRWSAALLQPADEAAARLLTAKLTAIERGEVGLLILRVLVGEPRRLWAEARPPEREGALELVRLLRATEQAPELGLGHYLLGRQLFARGGFREAAEALERSLERGLPDRRFTLQARRLLGQAQLRAGRAEAAREIFAAELAALGPEQEGERLELRDWIERASAWPQLTAALRR